MLSTGPIGPQFSGHNYVAANIPASSSPANSSLPSAVPLVPPPASEGPPLPIPSSGQYLVGAHPPASAVGLLFAAAQLLPASVFGFPNGPAQLQPSSVGGQPNNDQVQLASPVSRLG